MRPPLLSAALLGLLVSSCFSPGDGQAPPLESFYFPTGLTLDTAVVNRDGAPKYLYVASSDFDLQYRSSALMSLNLDVLRSVVPRSCATSADCSAVGELCDTTPSRANQGIPSFFCVASVDGEPGSPCGALGDRSPADQLLNPGRCLAVAPSQYRAPDGSPLIQDRVGIGAFATDVILRANPLAPMTPRLFMPVRGDATLHWIDLEDGKFSCGQAGTSDQGCDGAHRAGDSTAENANQLRQPAEPFAVAATSSGEYIAVTNQTSGSVSLFHNDWNANVGPTLESILTGLPLAPVAISELPDLHPSLSAGSSPGFLVAYRNAPQIDLLRVRNEAADSTSSPAASYTRYTLTRAGSTPINANSLGFDSRDIAIDGVQRQRDYDACDAAGGDVRACALAAHQPNVFVANRAPSSLLVGSLTVDASYRAGTSELPAIIDSVALTVGPSRVVLGSVKVQGGATSLQRDASGPFELERRVFVVCFDSRRIFVYDPARRVIDSIINTGRGPYALAVDDSRGLAYVAHFTDSYLGVVSLDQRFPQTYATLVASIGTPSPPRSSK